MVGYPTTFLIKREYMSNEIEMTAQELAFPIAEELGYELVETKYTKNEGQNHLTFYKNKKGGIMIDDCETFSKAIDPILDEHDVSHGEAYFLNVSSLGLDREVITDDDYRRNLDEDLEIFFAKNVGKKKKTHGILLSYDENMITINEKGKKVIYERKDLDKVRPYIDFK